MNQNIRNIAIIAHVDHGKTTLIDALLKQSNVFRANQLEMNEECILDRNALERERGITIMAKNCAIEYQGVKINIIDTPGHADFSGEVERTISMADGAILIVDAQEGPMPQTRFVLKQALKQNLSTIVVINKIDKQFARIDYVVSKISDLFLELATKEHQLDFPILYTIGRQGAVFYQLPSSLTQAGSVKPLLDTIITHIPPPQTQDDLPFKMLVNSLDFDPYLGQIVIGKIHQGTLHVQDKIVTSDQPNKSMTAAKIMVFNGLNRLETNQVNSGDIVAIAGLEKVKIGSTLTHPEDTTPLPSIEIGEPTLHITIGPNTSPFSGREGEFFTARQIEARLDREMENNVSLKLEKTFIR